MPPLEDECGLVADTTPVRGRRPVGAIRYPAYSEFHYDSPESDLYGPATDSSDRVGKQAQIEAKASTQARSPPFS